MSDKLVRGITKNGFIRFSGLDSTQTIKEATDIHKFSITNRVLMGRLINATLLMSGDLKNEKDVVTLKIESNGIANGAIVTAKSKGNVKCLMPKAEIETSPDSETGLIDIKSTLGEGVLKIIKDLGLKTPYIGNVELKYGEIAEDLTYYYYQSEQIPTAIGLGILLDDDANIRNAGGYMIQLLPDTPEAIIEQLETNLKSFPNLSDMMDMGHEITDLLENFLLKGFDTKILEEIPVSYRCSCSKDKFSNALKLLGKQELQQAIKDKEKLTVVCHFCKTKYQFNSEMVEKIISELD